MTSDKRNPSSDTKKVAFFGIGNKYRKDDSIGLEILARLRTEFTGKGYLFFDIEIDIFGIEEKISQCVDVDLCIFIDAAGSKTLDPGTVLTLSFDSEPFDKTDFTTTTHGVTVTDFLQLLKKTKPEIMPENIVIVAVVVPDIGFGVGLSKTARESINKVMVTIKGILGGNAARE